MTDDAGFIPRHTSIHVLNGDDFLRLRELEADVANAQPQLGQLRMGDAPIDAVKAAARVRDDFMGEARGRAYEFHVAAVGKKAWRELKVDHPPRVDQKGTPNEEDDEFGFNVEDGNTFIVESCTKVTRGGVDLNLSPKKIEDLLDRISDNDFSRLLSAIVVLNEGESPDPKSEISSAVTRLYGETSTSREPLG